MPIQPFNGNTAVAFVDVAGFKRLMRNRDKAMETLARFYEVGYGTLRRFREQNGMSVEGLFVTDCGILFVRHQGQQPARIVALLLKAVEELNRRLFPERIQTTTSLALGFFRYNPLNEYDGLEKNYIFGDAYVDAYQDSSATPKMEPGMCRFLLNGIDLPPEAERANGDQIWSRCQRRGEHLYFYWMCNGPGDVERVNQEYEQASQSRFQIIQRTLQSCSETWPPYINP